MTMCGRFVASKTPEKLAEEFAAQLEESALPARYNVAPSSKVSIVENHSDNSRGIVHAHWGLIPSWAKDPSIGNKMINARAETVAEKPAFRQAFAKRRCIIPADGFYEWFRTGSKKLPYFIRSRSAATLAFAGLFEYWHDPNQQDDAPPIRSCSIITTSANDYIRRLHDRMPVTLEQGSWDFWLDRDNHDTNALQQLLVPAPSDSLEAWRVDAAVNNARNRGSELVLPLQGPDIEDPAGFSVDPPPIA